MSSPRSRGKGIYDQLKKIRPWKLIVTDADGTELEVTVPQDRRQKYEFVMNTLHEINWKRIDLCDKKGGVLFRHLRCAEDHRADEDAPEATEADDVDKVAQLVTIMKSAQRDALTAQNDALAALQKQFEPCFGMINRMIEVLLTRSELQEAQHQATMKLNQALSEDLVRAKLAQLPQLAGAGDGTTRPVSDRSIDRLMPWLLKAFLERDSKPDSTPATATPAATAAAAAPETPTATVTVTNGTTNGTKPKLRAKGEPVPAAPAPA